MEKSRSERKSNLSLSKSYSNFGIEFHICGGLIRFIAWSDLIGWAGNSYPLEDDDQSCVFFFHWINPRWQQFDFETMASHNYEVETSHGGGDERRHKQWAR
ncbi:hypothetical protein ACSBR1_030348 [Camellia fascicularis]